MSGEGKRAALLAATAICLCLATSPAAAGEETGVGDKLAKFTKGEKITLENRAFIRYWYNVQDSAVQGDGEKEPHANSFELWRYYFGAKAQVTPWLKARFTTDVGSDSAQTSTAADDGHSHKNPGEPRYGVYVRYAWLQAELMDNLCLRAGVIDNPYHSSTDKMWGYRYVFKNIGDEEKLWKSADAGAYLRYDLPSDFGYVVLGAVNGSGYKKFEDTDSAKNMLLQTWLQPLKAMGGFGDGLVVGAYVDYTLGSGDHEDTRLVYTGLAGYQSDIVTVVYQMVGQELEVAGSDDSVSGLGHGAYVRLDSPWKVGLLGRFIMWDADTSSDANRSKQQILAGVSYTPVPLLSIATSGLYTSWSEIEGDPLEEEITLMVNTEMKF